MGGLGAGKIQRDRSRRPDCALLPMGPGHDPSFAARWLQPQDQLSHPSISDFIGTHLGLIGFDLAFGQLDTH